MEVQTLCYAPGQACEPGLRLKDVGPKPHEGAPVALERRMAILEQCPGSWFLIVADQWLDELVDWAGQEHPDSATFLSFEHADL